MWFSVGEYKMGFGEYNPRIGARHEPDGPGTLWMVQR